MKLETGKNGERENGSNKIMVKDAGDKLEEIAGSIAGQTKQDKERIKDIKKIIGLVVL